MIYLLPCWCCKIWNWYSSRKFEFIFLSLGWCCKIWNKSTLVITDVACFISHHIDLAKFGTNSPWSSLISGNLSSPHYIGGEKLTLISASPCLCWKIKIDLYIVKCTNNISIIIIGVKGCIHNTIHLVKCIWLDIVIINCARISIKCQSSLSLLSGTLFPSIVDMDGDILGDL